MAGPIKAFVVLDLGMSRTEIQLALPGEPEVEIVGLVSGIDQAWVQLHETSADVLVVGCAAQSESVLNLIESAVSERPSRPVIVLSHGSPNGFTRRLFGVGADDVLMLPVIPEDVLFSLKKALARKAGATSPARSRAPLICVLGPKGGIGKTLSASSLAAALSEFGKTVALVDLDLQFGDVGLCMGLTPEVTIFDLVRSGGSLDEDKIEGFLTTHSSGVRVLMAPSRPEHAAVVSVEFLREVYTVLRGMFDFVVVDTPPGFTVEVIATIDNATLVCMIGMLDILSLKNTKLGLEILDLMGFPGDRIKLVLNRAHSRVGISNDEVAAIIGRQPDVFVPSDRQITLAMNAGELILTANPESEASVAYRQLAASILLSEPDARGGRGVLRLLARGT